MNVSRPGISLLNLALWFVLLAMSPPRVLAVTHDITVGDNFFSPANLTIQVGDTVRWNNAPGGNSHNVTADNGSFNSQTSNSFTFTQTFTSAGSFGYTCTLHPSQMSGTITVQSDGGGQAAELSLQSIDAPAGSFEQGESFMVSSTVQNSGNLGSDPYSLTFYASSNNSITSGDTVIGTADRAGLAIGAGLTTADQVTLPGTLAPGNYYIGGIIDIDDSDSSNDSNFDAEPITVTEAGSGFLINEGLNDAWFNAATLGQGFFITVFPDIQMMFLAWFTFDTERPPGDIGATLGEPGHRWLTAFGPYAGDTASLDVELTQGGVFDAAVPAVEQGPDGTIEVTFSGCNAGLVSYDISSAGVSGQVPIERIALDNVPFCEAQSAAQ